MAFTGSEPNMRIWRVPVGTSSYMTAPMTPTPSPTSAPLGNPLPVTAWVGLVIGAFFFGILIFACLWVAKLRQTRQDSYEMRATIPK